MTPIHDDPEFQKLQAFGDEGLAAALETHSDRLARILDLRLDRRLTGRVDTSDVLQEAFLESQKRLPRYLETAQVPVFVWLRGVVLDTLIHVHRRHFAQKRDATAEVSLRNSPQTQVSSLSIAQWMVADLTSPSQAVIRDEVATKVAGVLDSMDEVDREVLILRHFEQLKNDEVASVVGVKKAAASRRYMRALKRFREVFDILPGFEFGS